MFRAVAPGARVERRATAPYALRGGGDGSLAVVVDRLALVLGYPSGGRELSRLGEVLVQLEEALADLRGRRGRVPGGAHGHRAAQRLAAGPLQGQPVCLREGAADVIRQREHERHVGGPVRRVLKGEAEEDGGGGRSVGVAEAEFAVGVERDADRQVGVAEAEPRDRVGPGVLDPRDAGQEAGRVRAQRPGAGRPIVDRDAQAEERIIELHLLAAPGGRVVEDVPVAQRAVGAQLHRTGAQSAERYGRAHPAGRRDRFAVADLVQVAVLAVEEQFLAIGEGGVQRPPGVDALDVEGRPVAVLEAHLAPHEAAVLEPQLLQRVGRRRRGHRLASAGVVAALVHAGGDARVCARSTGCAQANWSWPAAMNGSTGRSSGRSSPWG